MAQTHDTVSAVMSADQFREFAEAVFHSLLDDLDEGVVQGWIENQESFQGVLREALMSNSKHSDSVYPVSVDYEMSVEELVRLGQYHWASNEITSENFSTKRSGTVEVVVELVHFNRAILFDQARRELDCMGYRPAELHELLAFGKKYPDIQRKFPIVALGRASYRWADHSVPCLGGNRGNRSNRTLYHRLPDGPCREAYRFAAVRK